MKKVKYSLGKEISTKGGLHFNDEALIASFFRRAEFENPGFRANSSAIIGTEIIINLFPL